MRYFDKIFSGSNIHTFLERIMILHKQVVIAFYFHFTDEESLFKCSEKVIKRLYIVRNKILNLLENYVCKNDFFI